MRRHFWMVLGMLSVVLALPTTAAASPWTIPQDELTTSLTYNFQYADSEHLPDGTHQAFPLDGEFTSSRLELGFRYGFTDRFEGAMRLSFKQVSYQSEPFLKGKGDDSDFGSRQEVYEKRLVDFSDTRIGAADFHFTGRYNLFDHRNLIKLTSETDLKLPAGYEEPKGTFEGDSPSGAVQDDVTLGDGQVDLTQKIVAGGYLPTTRSFARLGAGYSVRFGVPGHQLVGGVKLGQNIGDNVVVFAGTNGAYTVTDGQVIGKSFITRSPELSGRELTGGQIEPVDITLDKDYLQASGGIIFRLDAAELQFNYTRMLVGRNIPQLQTFSVSTVFSFADVTAEDDEETEEDG